jgi:hypothetical protein
MAKALDDNILNFFFFVAHVVFLIKKGGKRVKNVFEN